MEFQEIVNIISNTGVSIAVIAYFCVRDWKFQETLQKTLVTLVDSIETLKDLINKEEK